MSLTELNRTGGSTGVDPRLLRGNGGASSVGTSTGETVESRLAYLNRVPHDRSHKYGVLYELPSQFAGYSAVIAAGGYNYMYATGHTFDHVANELWVAYQADGGDAAQWYVVYDMTTKVQKTYFKCGVRWTKSFNLHYTAGKRLIYGRGANSYLAAFDVTVLPAAGGTVAQYAQPKLYIGALFSSVMGDQLLVAHRGQTTNTSTEFNTYLVIDPATFEHRQILRLNTVAAGDTDGFKQLAFKTQGMCFSPAGVAMSYGGIVLPSESATKAVTVDYRSIQGVALRSTEGVVQQAGLFDPFKAITVLQGLGYAANRFETEGLNYDSKTQRLTTLWQINGDIAPSAKILIVEAFSSDKGAIDLSSCAVNCLPNVPEVMSLYRNDQNNPNPRDPVTGQEMPDVSDLCNMMMRYDQRMLSFYSTNFSALTFNGAPLVGSSKVQLFRGTNTTFFLNIRNTGVNQEWVIQVAGSTFTYTRMKMIANEYMFEATGTGDLIGNGSPEGVVVASTGSTYRNRLGGAGNTIFFKESGTGNTGWVGK